MPSTLKLAGNINGQEVVVLIDGSATYNFIQSRLAEHLGLTIQPLPHLQVTVGNGESLGCSGKCRQVPIKLNDALVSVGPLLLPIYGADLVLGVQWFVGLGPVVFNYHDLWMEFDHNVTYICLHGLTQVALGYISPLSLSKQIQS